MIFFRKEPKTIQNSKGLLVLLPLVVLLGMMGCTQAKNENSPNENSANVVLRVAILGDAEPKPKPEFPGLSSAVDRINALAAHAPIHFTIGVGDIAHKATDIQYENATPHLQRLTMPFYPIMGNEEHHGSVQKFLKYANLWGNGKTSFDSPRYVLETPQVGFVFASPDFGRDF
jgi:3',5'-cyclic-AMP phosphodiesterase